ncbi:hypothetical protein C3941_22835 [Kaistia algarum]|uniref:sulfatase-like hydrolase/transferase n=1 Tax=Kaistia algarum TaxID=2083279 RepID=UPI000CE894CC|nr:sulfatase-like hydrolase/transferase [Kaistia algarum]MCX5514545.1 sulfatase-like hydrolase/transferase [Kaistia algarum]PPE77586.1 hypothetical protein C3941_22835 [Kaistia algarum]
MTALLAWLGAAAILLVAERRPKAVLFTMSAFAFLTALFLLPFGDAGRAVLFALVLSLTIAGASAVKHHHSGMKLAFADLALSFAGTLPFMVRQYRRTAMLTFATAAGLALIALLGGLFLRGHTLGWPQRWLVLATSFGAMMAAYVAAGGARRFRADLNAGARFFSFFLASIVDVASWWPTNGLRMLDVGEAPLPLAAPRSARSSARPDIIVVQHESVFDPRLFGLPVDDRIGAFLAPAGGHSGRLHVDIYGGGSWQTEFSLLTGLSSASFGPDSYFLFKKGVGRFPHALPTELAGLGYRTLLATSCRRDFLNYDAFYAGIGVEERHFSDTYPPPFDLAAFEITNSDTEFFAATQAALVHSIDADPAPRFVMALTNFNHGPHETRIIPPGIREAARAFAMRALPDPTYAEYCARLDETAESWAAFKAALAARYPGRPMLFVRYGDHQPTMTRAIEQALSIPTDDPRQFETFFALEAVGFEPDFAGLSDRLDIAMLGTAALAASGLPLDAITATRLSLMEECGAAYMASPSSKKRAFHRALVEQGAIRLAPDATALRIAAERA